MKFKVRKGYTVKFTIPAKVIIHEEGKIFDVDAKAIKGQEHKVEKVK